MYRIRVTIRDRSPFHRGSKLTRGFNVTVRSSFQADQRVQRLHAGGTTPVYDNAISGQSDDF